MVRAPQNFSRNRFAVSLLQYTGVCGGEVNDFDKILKVKPAGRRALLLTAEKVKRLWV